MFRDCVTRVENEIRCRSSLADNEHSSFLHAATKCGRWHQAEKQEIKSCRVADRAALDVWRRLCTGEETKRKMSAGSKINNLSAAHLSSLRFPVLFTPSLFCSRVVVPARNARRKYPKEIASSSLAELKAVASAIFMIATQVRVRCLAAHSRSARAGGIFRAAFTIAREALQPRSAAAAHSQRKNFLVDRSCDFTA